jgi:quinol monooxygenase YgiN
MTHESTEDAGVFMFYLIRTNEDSFQKHVASPHVQAFDATGAAAEVLVGPYLHSRQRHMG